MVINLYEARNNGNGGGNLVIMYVPKSPDSTVQFVYECDYNDTNDTTTTTKLVSGYEKNKRPISMTLRQIYDDAGGGGNTNGGGYIISCFILPFVSRGLLENKCFSRPPTVVVMKDLTSTSVWHVLSVRKNRESLAFKNVQSVIVNQNLEYKILLQLTGNVSAQFVNALSSTTGTCARDLDSIISIDKNVIIDESPVIVSRRPR
uniref:Ac146 protein n=1 Tax=Spodoptera littoralis nuclear polyhedrosis virus TaxID=10456 RepID=A0A3G4S8T8_NPVSL|nr:ac146 protein [Spodoptera littoralis nucleopolyhedrovirus]